MKKLILAASLAALFTASQAPAETINIHVPPAEHPPTLEKAKTIGGVVTDESGGAGAGGAGKGDISHAGVGVGPASHQEPWEGEGETGDPGGWRLSWGPREWGHLG